MTINHLANLIAGQTGKRKCLLIFNLFSPSSLFWGRNTLLSTWCADKFFAGFRASECPKQQWHHKSWFLADARALKWNLGPIHTGCGAPCNMRTQIMEHTAVNGSVHTGCMQHQRVCTQICVQIYLRVLCERGLDNQWPAQVHGYFLAWMALLKNHTDVLEFVFLPGSLVVFAPTCTPLLRFRPRDWNRSGLCESRHRRCCCRHCRGHPPPPPPKKDINMAHRLDVDKRFSHGAFWCQRRRVSGIVGVLVLRFEFVNSVVWSQGGSQSEFIMDLHCWDWKVVNVCVVHFHWYQGYIQLSFIQTYKTKWNSLNTATKFRNNTGGIGMLFWK